ncbi:MAG TPA: extradiol dioxygenase [Alphaproteobacteria bacterium]|nr:extradiol dioxygenase [Alphaproteobacteria bacterium]
MAEIVAGIGISHAPGALGWPDAPPKDVKQRLDHAAARLGRRMIDARPDVIIALLDDHFENHFRNLLPTLAIGVADHHMGPAEIWLEALRLDRQETFPGQPDVAEALLRSCVAQGFDVARMGAIEYGNNLLVPWKIMDLGEPIPVIPIYFNVFSPPLMPYTRAVAFGRALRKAVHDLQSDLRVAFLATGGLSHWPPFWTDSSDPDDEFLQMRMRRFQTEGRPYLANDPGLYTDLAEYEIRMARENQWPANAEHPLVNDEWDREFLAALERGDEAYVAALSYEEVEREAGHGAHEILNWLALMGAMGSAPAQIVAYEAVPDWICGMAYVDFMPQRPRR